MAMGRKKFNMDPKKVPGGHRAGISLADILTGVLAPPGSTSVMVKGLL